MMNTALALNIQSTLCVPTGDREIDEMFRLGLQFMKQKKYDRAAEKFRDTLRRKPDHFAAIEQLGIISRELEDHETSLNFFRALTEHVPLYPQGYGYVGAALMTMERYEEASEYFRKALTFGKYHFAQVGLGNCFMYMGKDDMAGEYLKQAMEQNYDSPEILYSYFYFYYKFKSIDDPHFQHVLNLVSKTRKKMEPTPLAALYTVLYKAYDDIGEYDKAMEYAALAGKTRLLERGHNVKTSQVLFKAIREYFDADFFSQVKPSGVESRMPVFILGMPRSGTTLLEQILHSHPDVTGIGEDRHFGKLLEEKSFLPPYKGKPYPLRTKPLSKGVMNLKELALDHLAYLESKANGAKRVVDKGIIQYAWVSMLYLAFPNAYFIHLTRDPLSSGISAYTRNFAQNAHPYTNDLNYLGQTFRQHYEIMEHWKKVVPAKILDLSYESLVEDTENQARRVIEFLDLPWDDRCLEFHKTKKVVKTASAQQVRKPIYKDSLQTWKKYDKHLAPLVEGLGPYAPPESLYILEKYGTK